MFFEIGCIYNYAHEVVPIENASMTPMSFNFLCFVTGRPEMRNYFQNRFDEPLRIDGSSIIELKGKQNLEPPPRVAHRWSFL